MQTVNIDADETQLSRLVDAAAAGEEIVIARAGRPVARLMPLEAVSQKIIFGLLEQELGPIPDDFDAPLPDDLLDSKDGDADPAGYARPALVAAQSSRR